MMWPIITPFTFSVLPATDCTQLFLNVAYGNLFQYIVFYTEHAPILAVYYERTFYISVYPFMQISIGTCNIRPHTVSVIKHHISNNTYNIYPSVHMCTFYSTSHSVHIVRVQSCRCFQCRSLSCILRHMIQLLPNRQPYLQTNMLYLRFVWLLCFHILRNREHLFIMLLNHT